MASSCTFASGQEVHTKTWYRNQASSYAIVNIDTGNDISGTTFNNDLQGYTAWFNDYYPTEAWYRQSGDYSFGVNFTNNGCNAVAVFFTQNSSHSWTDICIAGASGQVHTVCNFDVPDGITGALWTGEYNSATGQIATNPQGTPIRT
jgi:hypothetical protein